MKKANILYTSHTSELKMGGQMSLFNIVKRLNREKYQPILLCPGKGPLSQHFKEIDCLIVYHRFPQLRASNFFKLIICFIYTARILKNFRVDLVHSDHPTDTFYLGVCSRVLRIPLLWHARVSSVSRLDHLNFRLASRTISVSNSVAKRFIADQKKSQKHTIIHNAVDCYLFKPSPKGIDNERFGFGKGEKIVTTVCQLIKEKGVIEFIEAAKIVCSKTQNCRFIIAGEGADEFKNHLNRLIDKYELCEYIHLIGFRDDIPAVLNSSDIFVLASYIEGFPRTVIEAMACGKPVIGTDVEGVNEAVIDNITGLLVPTRDPARLSEAIIKLLMDEKQSRAMGQAGRKRVEKLFSISSHVDSIEAVYREMLDRKNNAFRCQTVQ